MVLGKVTLYLEMHTYSLKRNIKERVRLNKPTLFTTQNCPPKRLGGKIHATKTNNSCHPTTEGL